MERQALKAWWTGVYHDDRKLQIVVVLWLALWCGFLFSQESVNFVGLTFNSMAEHLLHGRFDVDPGAVGMEGFLRDGKIYSYWGIWCALLRLPLVLSGHADLDITVASCTMAVVLMGWMNLRTLLLLRRHAQWQGLAARSAFALVLVYIVFGGAQVGYLKSSIFQEVLCWSAAFGAGFVYAAMRGLTDRRFARGALIGMAVCAGLAMLTRAPTGVGLCLAFGLLLTVFAFEGRRKNADVAFRFADALPALAILAVLLAAAGAVNYFRWGSPFTFADHAKYLFNARYPDRLLRLRKYGYFSLRRLPLGLAYYFLPIWVLHGPHGELLLNETVVRLLDAAELPPSSLFLTDALPFGMAALLVVLWHRGVQRGSILWKRFCAASLGLLAPCVMMLLAYSMAYRYRMEFYPWLNLSMYFALYLVLHEADAAEVFLRWRPWLKRVTVLSVVAAFAFMVLYKLSPFGPPQDCLSRGLAGCYIKLATK